MIHAAEPTAPAIQLTDEQRKELRAEVARLWKEAQALDKEGKLTEALATGEKMLVVNHELLGIVHDEIVLNLKWLATRYESREKFSAAKKHRTDVVAIRTQLLVRDHWQVIGARGALTHTELLATLSAEKRQQLREGQALLAEVQRLDGERKYPQAIPVAEKVVFIRKTVLGAEHPDFAEALSWLGLVHDNGGDPVRAETLYRQVLEIRKKVQGEAHPDYAGCLNDLALLYKVRRDYARAESLYLEALDVAKRAWGETHIVYAYGLHNLAYMYEAKPDYMKAESLFRQSLEIIRAERGEAHPDFATTLRHLGYVYRLQGDYARAEPFYRQTLEIRRTALGETHPEFAESLNDLALLYESQRDYTRAESLYRQAIEIKKKALGAAHPEYAMSLDNLGRLLSAQGDYARAEPLFRESLEIRRKALGETHPEYAASLNKLGLLYRSLGDYARAELNFRQALKITRSTLGEAHLEYATRLNNLAALHFAQGNVTLAEPLYRQALEIWKKVVGESHPSYATGLNNLAEICLVKGLVNGGDLAEAESLYRRALEIRRKSLGESHRGYAESLNNLASVYDCQGDYAQAERLYRQASEIWKRTLGESHPDYAHSLTNLASLHMTQDKYAQAEPLYRQALEISLTNLNLAAANQSERGQLLMAAELRPKLDNYLSLAVYAGDYQPAVYERMLAWKGMVLARQRAMQAITSRPDLAPIAAELQGTTTRLASLALATPKPEQAESWRKQTTALSAKKEELEQKLAAASAEFRAAIKPITVAELRAALPANGVLVDFQDYEYTEPKKKANGVSKSERRIAAFIVGSVRQAGSTEAEVRVQLIDLGSAWTIGAAIDAWRSGFGQSAESRAAGDTLREKLWLPIEQHLAGATTVLISPDGDLGRLSFAALPGKKPGTYLVEEYALAIVPSAQAIVGSARQAGLVAAESPNGSAPARRADATANLLVLGSVDYDRRSEAKANEEQPKRPFASRAARDEADLPFLPLAGTKGELATIEKLYRKTFGTDGIRSLEGPAATQEALVAAASKHLYLHLATHGYFAAPRYKSALDRSIQDGKGGAEAFVSNQSLAGYHPGLLSGIALAGANQPTEEDDGILTAVEISSLNLSACELVVLSACETGLGQAAGGEGLLGVQRAFQVAGAKTVIASLWKVDDAATRDLMERFYETLWSKTKSDGQPYTKLEALREAQLFMLKQRGPRGLTPVEAELTATGEKRLPPYFWAGFVLSGDWR